MYNYSIFFSIAEQNLRINHSRLMTYQLLWISALIIFQLMVGIGVVIIDYIYIYMNYKLIYLRS